MIEICILILTSFLITTSIEQIEINLIPSSFYRKQDETMSNSISTSKEQQDELFLFPVKIGYPPQSFHLLVDTNTYGIWIQDSNSSSKIPEHQKTFNNQVSSTFNETHQSFSLSYCFNKCSDEFIGETIDFGPTSIVMKIPLVKDYSSHLLGKEGILGVSRSIAIGDKNQITMQNSIIPLLQGLNYTEKNMFSLQWFSYPNPKMYIGKEHKDFKSNKDNVISCNTTNNPSGHWSCLSTMIIHNNTGIPINREVVLDSTIENIYFPIGLMPIFKKMLISKKNCKEKDQENDQGTYFDCNSLDDWLPFALVFNNTVLRFPNRMLVSQYDSNKFYSINVIFSDKYEDIHLGTSLFKHYHVLFDNEKNFISFYSINKDNVAYLSAYPSLVIYKAFFNNVFFLLLVNGCIILVYIIFKVVKSQIKKNKKYPMELFVNWRYSRMKNSSNTINNRNSNNF